MRGREEGDEGEEKNRSQPCGTLYRPRLHRLHFPGGSESKESACNVEDVGLIPGSGRVPGEGNDNPLQYSCLENSTDREAWWAILHGVTKSWTQLGN